MRDRTITRAIAAPLALLCVVVAVTGIDTVTVLMIVAVTLLCVVVGACLWFLVMALVDRAGDERGGRHG